MSKLPHGVFGRGFQPVLGVGSGKRLAWVSRKNVFSTVMAEGCTRSRLL